MFRIGVLEAMSIVDITSATAVAGAIYLVSVWLYRLTLHPYAKYPGPFLGKVTSLYGAYHAYFGNIHLDVERCHQTYGSDTLMPPFLTCTDMDVGKFVRYSPNGLLVNSATGYQDIYGQLKKVHKANSYQVHGEGNLIGMQDKKAHAKKKKIFQQGFSDIALRKHEGKVLQEIEVFCQKLLENESSGAKPEEWTDPKNMSLWCNYLTTDVICKVVFTTSWDLVSSAANRTVTKTMSTVVHLLGVMHQTPLLQFHSLVALLLPHLAWCVTSLKKYTSAVIKSSLQVRKEDSSTDDVFKLYVEAKDPDTGNLALGKFDVMINSANLLIAGNSMAATFFYLSRNPEAYSKVINEIRATFSSPDEIRLGPTLNGCVYLRAAINEAMRMCPVAPQPLWRRCEPDGCIVDGEYIPGGLNVGATIFSLHHDPAVFEDPYTYNIERWINHGVDEASMENEKVRIKAITANFAPFSTGPRQCLAKNFALMELTLTLANVFWRMDFRESAGALGKVGEGAKGSVPLSLRTAQPRPSRSKLLNMSALVLDVLVIGGGPGGLAVATGLARQLYNTVIFDSGVYRNARATHMHNFLGWDHQNPANLRAKGREDLMARYKTVTIENTTIQQVRKTELGTFEAFDDKGRKWTGRKVVLATGVKDVFPNIHGFDECWGRGIFACLFCHGYEERGQKSAGILMTGFNANSKVSVHMSQMARRLAENLVFYTNGSEEKAAELSAVLKNDKDAVEGKIKIENRIVTRMRMGSNFPSEVILTFEDGTEVSEGFIVNAPATKPNGPFVEQLGLELAPNGDIKVSTPFQETSIDGVFAVGDCSTMMKTVSMAASTGSAAAGGISGQIGADLARI
ncbi:hypothetical protein jhhlp_005339 [Lomentospora prolificans]|uniref:FAD/NAD(P)-binding domain-containing protein n=1 Tax=Lomentospora prolificans TaxID=41688 RepID=A0A2N3N7H9_9PEZI|nr:hypothetical protein jhhlp_005339 [Lomentospora prolificans]